MKLQPVHRYPQPQLPTREIVDQSPDLLRLLPRRWQGNAAVVTALAACLAMSGCNRKAPASGPPSRVAPVFMRGDGLGSFGCKIINPPVFLSEDEARKVIADEAKRAGLTFLKDTRTATGVGVPVISNKGKTGWETQPLDLDGVDEKHNIAFEFVSLDDSYEWRAKGEAWYSVGNHNLQDLAKQLRHGLSKAKPGGTLAVFYDPFIGPSAVDMRFASKDDYEAASQDWLGKRDRLQEMQKRLSREQLRLQVKDFIKWLKAQGVI